MNRFRLLLAATLLAPVIGLAATADAGITMTITFTQSPTLYRHGPSQNVGAYHEIGVAQADLARAYAQAAKSDPVMAEMKAAQDTAAKARKDYNAMFADARKSADADPALAPLAAAVSDLEQQLTDEKDFARRVKISGDLMTARGKLNLAEQDGIGVDPDLAIAKAAYDDAQAALKAVQAKRQTAVQQDPGVQAAKQRLDGLRQQLAHR